MKRMCFAAITPLIIAMLLTGCGSKYLPAGGEITGFEIVRVLGIDKHEDGVEVTLIAERAKPSPGEEGGGMSYEILSETGKTALEAVTRLRAVTDKKQVFGYVDYIIFGESAVSDDISKYADYPARNPEIRYSPKVFVSRGMTAKQLLSQTSTGDKYIGDSLDNLSMGVNRRSDFSTIRNIELMNMLDRNNIAAAVIPAIEGKEDSGDILIDGELPEKKLSAAGYAVVRDFKLAGYFGGDIARGYNFLTDELRSSAFSVDDGDGAYAALDTVSSAVRITPRFEGDKLGGITITIGVNAALSEQQSRESLFTPEKLKLLEERLKNEIEYEARAVIEKTKEFGIDCLDLAGEIRMRHPYKWRKIESSWRDIYKTLSIEVKAEAAIRRVYDLREPSGYGL